MAVSFVFIQRLSDRYPETGPKRRKAAKAAQLRAASKGVRADAAL